MPLCAYCKEPARWYARKAASGGPFGQGWRVYTCSGHVVEALERVQREAPGVSGAAALLIEPA